MKQQKRLKGYSLKEQIALFASFERLEGFINAWRKNGEYEKFDDFLIAVAQEKTENQVFKRFEKLLFKEWSSAIQKHIKSYRERGIETAYEVYLTDICERHKEKINKRRDKG